MYFSVINLIQNNILKKISCVKMLLSNNLKGCKL